MGRIKKLVSVAPDQAGYTMLELIIVLIIIVILVALLIWKNT